MPFHGLSPGSCPRSNCPMENDTSTERLGGRPFVNVLVFGSTDLVASLTSGTDPAPAVRDAVLAGSGDRTQLRFQCAPQATIATILERLRVAVRSDAVDPDELFDQARPDVVAISLAPDVLDDGDPDLTLDRYRECARLIREDLGAHMVVANGSSVDPRSPAGAAAETSADRVRRLNLMIIRASMLEGISVLDVDRLAAELGAGKNVTGFLEYADGLREEIGREFVRVLAYYGFFEERPLIAQVGQSETVT
jgi:hypothetical protein